MNALRNNLNKIKMQLKNRTRLLLMLKANAYGHGAIEVANATTNIVDWYGVANAEEGVELRLNDIAKPILVTVFSPCDSELVIKYNLTPIIYNIEQADALNKFAMLANKVISIHIKIDTGMNRLGTKSYIGLCNLINHIKCFSNLRLQGICTHYYDNDVVTLDKQKAIFDKFTYNYDKLILHTASSNSVLLDRKYHYNMVRIGISAYGYSDIKNDFQPVMNVISTILDIKNINKGEISGYSSIFRAEENTKLAIIRGGYYDGISRNMVGANVIISGKLCKIIAVCMDITMINIGNLESNVGDEVIILGILSLNKNTATELARHCKTIPYEILTNIKGRIERIYYD